jgi:hypothetical protein
MVSVDFSFSFFRFFPRSLTADSVADVSFNRTLCTVHPRLLFPKRRQEMQRALGVRSPASKWLVLHRVFPASFHVCSLLTRLCRCRLRSEVVYGAHSLLIRLEVERCSEHSGFDSSYPTGICTFTIPPFCFPLPGSTADTP